MELARLHLSSLVFAYLLRYRSLFAAGAREHEQWILYQLEHDTRRSLCFNLVWKHGSPIENAVFQSQSLRNQEHHQSVNKSKAYEDA
jgi:hypothetical protein